MAFASQDHLTQDTTDARHGGPDPGREVGAYPDIGKLKTWFREAEEAFWSARIYSERVRDYVDNKQWTDAESEQLRKRGQSDIVFNRMRPKVNIMLGLEKKMRADPKAYPRTPQHEDDADLATDAVRYVCENRVRGQPNFDAIASMVFDQACCVEGEAGCEVEVEFTPNVAEPEIVLRMNAYDRTFRDPHSRMPDYSDARYLGSVVWMDAEQARARWPEADEAIGSTMTATSQTSGDTFEDAPRYWADRARNRVQIIKLWWQTGAEWQVATFVGGGFIDEPRPSPYVDEQGNTVCGLELCSGYVSRQGERYGLAHIWVGPQDAINKRQSKALHILSTRQTYSDPGVFENVRKVKSEMSKPDGHVEKDAPGEFGVLPTGEMAMGQFQLLQEAKEEIDSTGPTSASSTPGQGLGNTSGIALQSDQQAGMLEVDSLFDHHRDWKLRVYRAIWCRIRQFWKAPRWIRVTDDDKSMRWVGMNTPITAGQVLQERFKQDPEMLEIIETRYANDPRAQMVVAIQNQPAELDVDMVLDTGPDVVTTAAQEFEMLVELWRNDKNNELSITQLIEASNMRSKERLLEALRGNEEQQKAQAAAAQEADEIAKAGMVAELEQTQANVDETTANAAYKVAQAREIAAKLPSDIELTEAQADKATADAMVSVGP